jgi:hypothetical protein
VKLVFVAAKVFVRASTVTEVFARLGKMFFVIIRVKAVYFDVFGGFDAFGCEKSVSCFCQLLIFFRCCEK